MDEEGINKLIDCLFILVKSLNTVVDRLDILANHHGELIKKNDEVFTKINEIYWRKIIEHEVNQEIEKKNKREKL